MLGEFREWLMLLLEAGIFYYVCIEYHYDRNKDIEKKQKKTRISKKVTTNKDGQTVTEEATETSEPVQDTKI